MKLKLIRYFRLALLHLCATAVLFSQTPPANPPLAFSPPTTEKALEGFDVFVEDVLKKWRAPGAAIAIVKDGKVVLSKGYGVRDPKTGAPVTKDTIFSIASITKQFSSFGVGLLVDEGKVEFDAPVKNYIPEFKTNDSFATSLISIRDLLAHRSGLPELTFLERDPRLTREEMVKRLPHIKNLTPVRTHWEYANINYGLVARAVEKISGVEWETFMTERVFKPMGLTRTTFSYERAVQDPNHAVGTMEGPAGTMLIPLPRYSEFAGSAGGIYSTADDLAKWMLVHLSKGKLGDKQIIQPRTLAEMHKTHFATNWGSFAPEVVPIGYGLGWFTEVHRGEPMIMAGGDYDGVSTLHGMLPRQGLGVVILVNQNSSLLTFPIMRDVFDRFMGEKSRDWVSRWLQIQQSRKSSATSSKQEREAERKTDTQPSHKLSEYVGTFNHPGYGDVTVRLNGDKLTINWAGFASPLAHWHYDVFMAATEDISSPWAPGGYNGLIRFYTDFEGRISALEIGGLTGVQDVIFSKQANAKISSAS